MALSHGVLSLQWVDIVFPIGRELAPYHHFRILAGSVDVGHINLRIGESGHLQRVVGHIGFGIRSRFRGHGYALSACWALGPFARVLRRETILTCDPGNHASRRTLERLVGGLSGEEVSVPIGDPHYGRGARTKLRFRWVPSSGVPHSSLKSLRLPPVWQSAERRPGP